MSALRGKPKSHVWRETVEGHTFTVVTSWQLNEDGTEVGITTEAVVGSFRRPADGPLWVPKEALQAMLLDLDEEEQ